MTHRYHVYKQAIPDTNDQSNPQTEGMVASARLAADVWFATANPIGATGATTRAAGFIPSFPTGMVITLGDGRLYTLAAVDATAYDNRGADSRQVLQQGESEAASLTFAAAPAAGNTRIDLVQVAFSQVDDTPKVYSYYAGPGLQALQGPTGMGETQNSRRAALATVVVKSGVAAATGSQVAPTADAGYFPLFLVTIASGVTNLTASNMAVAPSAPFFNGAAAADALVEHIANKGVASGYASLDSAGKVPVAQIPSYAITDVFTVASQAAMLALTAQQGDIARRSDLSQQFILAGTGDPTVLANWLEWLIPTDTAYLDVAQTWTAQQTFNAPVAFSGSTFAEVEAGTFYMTQNCYFDGTNWQRVNTANPYAAEAMDQYGKRLFFAGPSGANPIGTTLQARDLADEYFGTDWHTTTGLTYGYLKGIAVLNNTITQVAANVIGLTASATNYFEVDPGSGVIYMGTSGFTPGRMPISQIVTNATGIALNGITPANSSFIKFTSLPSDLLCSAGAGLVLNYAAGQVNLGGVPASDAANTLTLTASSTCYVYLNSQGVVSFNTTGFAVGLTPIPLAQVVTGAATITSVADKRAFLTLGGSTASPAVRNAIQSCLMDASTNGKAAFMLGNTYVMTSSASKAIDGGSVAGDPSSNVFYPYAATPWESSQQSPYVSGAAWIGQDSGSGNTVTVTSITFTASGTVGYNVSSVLFQTSPDLTNWTTTDTIALNTAASAVTTYALAVTQTARAWRLLANANNTSSGSSWVVPRIDAYALSGGASTTTAIDLKATTAPLTLSFSNGLNADGTFNCIPAQLSADVNAYWTSLIALTTNYAFILRNPSTGALSPLIGAYPQIVSTVAPPEPNNSGYAPPTGAAATWHMDEFSGATVADSAGTYTGTATGTAIVASPILGNARSFNGTTDYITTTGNPIPDAGTFSFSFYMKSSLAKAYYAIARGYGPVGSNWYGVVIYVGTDGAINFFRNPVGTINHGVYTAGGAVSANVGAFVTVTFNVTTGVPTIIVNGVATAFTYNDGTDAANGHLPTGAINYNGTPATTLGADSNAGPYAVGIMDEVYVYLTVLTTAQAAALMYTKPTVNRYFDPVKNTSNYYNGTAWVVEQCVSAGQIITNGAGQVTGFTEYPPARLQSYQSVVGSTSAPATTTATAGAYIAPDPRAAVILGTGQAVAVDMYATVTNNGAAGAANYTQIARSSDGGNTWSLIGMPEVISSPIASGAIVFAISLFDTPGPGAYTYGIAIWNYGGTANTLTLFGTDRSISTAVVNQ